MGHIDSVWAYINRTILFLPGIIIGLTVHEFSHALLAHLCGDDTSKEQGRVTLNPLKHIDPYGFIMLLIAGFGWAKPVQFNESRLNNPKTDVIKIAMAGPLSNAIIAMLLSLIMVVAKPVFNEIHQVILNMMYYAIFINWGLFVFNLIPLPPLDGSHLLFYPFRKHPSVYNAIYRYGSLLLFGLIILSIVSRSNFIPIGRLIESLTKGFLNLIGF